MESKVQLNKYYQVNRVIIIFKKIIKLGVNSLVIQ